VSAWGYTQGEKGGGKRKCTKRGLDSRVLKGIREGYGKEINRRKNKEGPRGMKLEKKLLVFAPDRSIIYSTGYGKEREKKVCSSSGKSQSKRNRGKRETYHFAALK